MASINDDLEKILARQRATQEERAEVARNAGKENSLLLENEPEVHHVQRPLMRPPKPAANMLNKQMAEAAAIKFKEKEKDIQKACKKIEVQEQNKEIQKDPTEAVEQNAIDIEPVRIHNESIAETNHKGCSCILL